MLAAVDVVGGPVERGVGHDVHRERGDVGGADDTTDGQRGPQLVPAILEIGRARSDADNGVSTKPAAMRLTRTGANSSARAAVNGDIAAVAADEMPSPRPTRRAPVPPMKMSVPPGRILGAAWRATSRPSTT